MTTASGSDRGRSVQSVERALELLERIADAGGETTLSDLADSSGLPLPSVHRIMRTLVQTGYARRQPSRRYSLGARLIRLGDTASQALGAWATPYLAELTRATGETANMALLDGDQIVYVAQVPSPHAMRMFADVGRRVDAHASAVGKALMAHLSRDAVTAMLTRTGMHPHTERTITTINAMHRELAQVRELGYAVDDSEQDLGVRCYAVVVPDAPSNATISISGPEGRMARIAVDEVIPFMQDVARKLSAELCGRTG
jgi:IclR family acetate operon transcriptional repressor